MFARSVFIIEKDCGKENIEKISKSIIEFSDKHSMRCSIGYSRFEDLVCDVVCSGLTTSYCRGCIAEVKEMLKKEFDSKIKTNFSAY